MSLKFKKKLLLPGIGIFLSIASFATAARPVSKSTSFVRKIAGDAHALLPWRVVGPGLRLATPEVPSVLHPEIDPVIVLIRVDTTYFDFDLYASVESPKGELRTARDWAKSKNLEVVFNAGMYEPDYRPTGYARIGKKVLSVKPARTYTTHLLMNQGRLEIVDGDCLPDREILSQAASAHSDLAIGRLIDCDGKSVKWNKSNDLRASMLVFGKVDDGDVIIAFSRAPRAIDEFKDNLKTLGIDFKKLIYLEGGPESSLSLNSPSFAKDWVGSFETGFYENDKNEKQWPIPNVIGLKRIKDTPEPSSAP